jgi:DNA (cytosine-5)-methyltransferase 1
MSISRRRPTAIDLFSGAGGLSLGFEQAGFDILCAAEYDPIHAATHAYNFPHTEMVCEDISAITGERLLKAARKGWRAHGKRVKWDKEVDVLVGGPPCQGFSTGGKREIDDARNKLVFRFAELVGELKPKYFVMENVQGLASFVADASGQRLLQRLIGKLRAQGYEVAEPIVLNACAFGVPQDRRRLFLLGAREGLTLPTPPARRTRGRLRRPDGHIPTGSAIEGLPECPSVWDAIGDLPNADDFDDLLDRDVTQLADEMARTIDESASRYVKRLRGVEVDPCDLSRERVWKRSLLTSSCRTIHRDEVLARFEKVNEGYADGTSKFFRLYREGVSPTLRAGSHYERGSFNAPRPIHPIKPRVITVREAARLHSFPDWFRFHWTKWHGFRQVGNSVPPLIGRAVAETIITALDVVPSRTSKSIDLGDDKLLLMENLDAARHFKASPDRMPRNALRVRPPAERKAA